MPTRAETIRAAQELLKRRFPRLEVDGVWGRQTARAFDAAPPDLRIDVIRTVADMGHSLNDIQQGLGDDTAVKPVPRASLSPKARPQPVRLSVFDRAGVFTNRVIPAVIAEARRRGVNAAFYVAQLALESGYGMRIPMTADDQPSYNYGGMKTNVLRGWKGDYSSVTSNTTEFFDGVKTQVKDGFAVFRSPEDFVQAYFWYLFDGPSSYRYKAGLHKAESISDFAGTLSKGGYATDPRYVVKVSSIADEVRSRYDLA